MTPEYVGYTILTPKGYASAEQERQAYIYAVKGGYAWTHGSGYEYIGVNGAPFPTIEAAIESIRSLPVSLAGWAASGLCELSVEFE